MSAVDAMIHCASCGRQSPWKPQYAGRKLRCKCGHVIEVRAAPVDAVDPEPPEILDEPASVAAKPAAAKPDAGLPGLDTTSIDDLLAAAAAESSAPATPPSADPVDDQTVPLKSGPEAGGGHHEAPPADPDKVSDDDDYGAYGLAPMEAIPVTRVSTADAYDAADDVDDDDDDDLLPPTSRAAAVAIPSSPILGYKSFQRRKNVEEDDQIAAYQRKEMILPAVLIAVGLLATFVEARITLGEFNILAMSVFVAVSTIINLVLIFAALLVAAKLLDLGLGEIGPALLKIAAVAILPSAVSGMILASTGFFGGMLAWGVSLALYFLLLYNLFEMDSQEMMITTVIIWFMRTWVAYFIIMAILNTGGDDEMDPSLQPGGGGGGNSQWVAPDDGSDGSAVDSDGDGIPDEPADPDDDPDAETEKPTEPEADKPAASPPPENKDEE